MLAEARDADAKQKTEAIIEQAVGKVINIVPRVPPESEFGAAAHRPVNKFGGPVHGVRTLPPFDNLRNEVKTIT